MKNILISFCFLFLSNILFAQDRPSVYNPDSSKVLGILPGNLVQINNYVSNRLVFSMSFDGENWKPFEILLNTSLLINLENEEQAYFRICTSENNNCIYYKIKGSRRYKLYWNFKENMWGLSRITEDR